MSTTIAAAALTVEEATIAHQIAAARLAELTDGLRDAIAAKSRAAAARGQSRRAHPTPQRWRRARPRWRQPPGAGLLPG